MERTLPTECKEYQAASAEQAIQGLESIAKAIATAARAVQLVATLAAV